MFRLAELYFEDRDIDKEFRKIFLQSFHPIKKRKITQKIEGMVSSKCNYWEYWYKIYTINNDSTMR